eukprot:3680732-Pleurochrysis_carterae.AAC.1
MEASSALELAMQGPQGPTHSSSVVNSPIRRNREGRRGDGAHDSAANSSARPRTSCVSRCCRCGGGNDHAAGGGQHGRE